MLAATRAAFNFAPSSHWKCSSPRTPPQPACRSLASFGHSRAVLADIRTTWRNESRCLRASLARAQVSPCPREPFRVPGPSRGAPVPPSPHARCAAAVAGTSVPHYATLCEVSRHAPRQSDSRLLASRSTKQAPRPPPPDRLRSTPRLGLHRGAVSTSAPPCRLRSPHVKSCPRRRPSFIPSQSHTAPAHGAEPNNADRDGDGITEGFHRKMKLIQRRAYGFRNFENYRLRVIAQCG